MLFRRHGVCLPIVCHLWFHSRSHEGDVKAIQDSLKELDPVAGEYGVKIYLEPLNRYQDHMLNTTKDGVDMIDMGHFKMSRLQQNFIICPLKRMIFLRP